MLSVGFSVCSDEWNPVGLTLIRLKGEARAAGTQFDMSTRE